ncbi:ATP-dependent DNA helicase RecG [Candidatus Woesebacteria bacterium RIFCSPHIGHO2_01_FULL_44_10]|uniref:Probable DNA 3'-5' helicase RecG n=1 Tax=Candidatus Woesebacteria bacterium RIFCSPLOWO2_01_FULL_44_14 TaxID=1802525 RepID=A0A1F8BZV0_9BACT|nr:MAG: ATP-dependent DNA helicase RecG [Candidatus Woesebacteria bacterium RIFCSPHIGHO2_01_FULL_44_10]OGM56427.1 MAG: ATP-dependent DNA helicase RecG [Candidatus Woesebacteria bacterium RIFCSPHIGHO2_12_FULL_44_11]OGM68828.1 MAG: ATP-dependent DNA helicase RecG [Candidatus Woesebacteria bacterium RIFCSPLOWO2_01_FULL_44_14]
MDFSSSVGQLPFVGTTYVDRLAKLGINTIGDLLHHVPHRYDDFRQIESVASLEPGEVVTVRGEIVSIVNQYTRSGRKIQIAKIADDTGTIYVFWFNQPFLIRTLPVGTKVSLAGKIGWWSRAKAIVSPEYEIINVGPPGGEASTHTGRLVPVYHETAGVSSKWLRSRIKTAFEKIDPKEFKDFLSKETLKKLNLTSFLTAIKDVHYPKNLEAAKNARRRLALNELLDLQSANIKKRKQWQKNKVSYQLTVSQPSVNQFISSLPFELTTAQKFTVKEILEDLQKNIPMNRLLEGDVGSGKTVVAAAAAYVAFVNGHQTVLMAPTQILATQHFETLKALFGSFGARVSLITSAITKQSLGRADIIVGTHALIHTKARTTDAALVIIDEQHKFGVEQREHLTKGTSSPHVLTMTATPIPRTVALTFYGDLDLSTLDELPPGRQKITTWVVPETKRASAYNWIRSQITSNQSQVFVICPLIDESEKETLKHVKSAKEEYLKLKKVFADFKVDLLHGRLKGKQKEKVMANFKNGQTAILVSTPVVEVGMDVPNATIMVIETADRFGLASLHQLRGRIGRGAKKSYCLLFAEDPSQKAIERLEALKTTKSGRQLAELDLKLRGPGEIWGSRQSGIPELTIATWSDIDLIKASKKVAEELVGP